MSDKPQNPFSALNAQIKNPEVQRGRLEQQYEHSMMNHTLQRLKLGSWKKRFCEQYTPQVPGGPWLRFSMFNEMFPSFPMWLGCDKLMEPIWGRNKETNEKEIKAYAPVKLHQREDSLLPQWFKKFLHLPFMPRYNQLFSRLGREAELKPVGMVFPRKGFAYGLIVHNGNLHEFSKEQSSAHVYVGGGDDPMMLVVQSYDGFLDAVYNQGRGWKPA